MPITRLWLATISFALDQRRVKWNRLNDDGYIKRRSVNGRDAGWRNKLTMPHAFSGRALAVRCLYCCGAFKVTWWRSRSIKALVTTFHWVLNWLAMSHRTHITYSLTVRWYRPAGWHELSALLYRHPFEVNCWRYFATLCDPDKTAFSMMQWTINDLRTNDVGLERPTQLTNFCRPWNNVAIWANVTGTSCVITRTSSHARR